MIRGYGLMLCALLARPLLAEEVIPHAQDKPPNAPRDAHTAARLMTVPEGFVVEVVACEPQIVNPVAMAIDEQGRFWITESVEYPRRSAGPGKDQVKILEDTNGDGVMDRITVFLDGLNIPSGVQVGHGGVWIANAPDLLFVPDADRDGRADGPPQVVVTGFGRTDTHELPNSLTWGPDGWLYGLNGVFNHSHVKYHETNPNYRPDHPGWPFTCAMFRIHPRTREFQVFCEGTSNPWGIAFNDEGDAFVSACVIDHLWHLVETGYYHRQGGPYPPHTWKIESIVKHKHQKAAYCGITWFDSDAYPEPYRRKLYMGNIHGGCINVDRIERQGSTYAGSGEPDFLTANDAWFMPVVQKTGPDGCLYILDWYDRYHCYQDANRDPAGIDRLKGRLYRVRYTKGAPGSAQPSSVALDLGKETDDQLIDRLGHPNGWIRETAQRLLQERSNPASTQRLLRLTLSSETPRHQRLHALFALLGRDLAEREQLNLIATAEKLLQASEPAVRPWGIRLLTNQLLPQLARAEHAEQAERELTRLLTQALQDADPRVRLQGLIGLTQLCRHHSPRDSLDEPLLAACQLCGEDPLLQRIAWQAVKAYSSRNLAFAARLLGHAEFLQTALAPALLPRLIDWLLGQPQLESPIFKTVLSRHEAPAAARTLLKALAERVQSRELTGERLTTLREALQPELQALLQAPRSPLFLDAALLATSWRDPSGYAAARQIIETAAFPEDQRLAAFQALIAAGQDDVLRSLARLFEHPAAHSVSFRGKLLDALGRLETPHVSRFVLEFYPRMEPELQPKAIELLTQRTEWSKALLQAVRQQQIPPAAISVNQARKMHETKDQEVRELLLRHWGQVREGRSPDRDRVIAEMRRFIREHRGDAVAGQAVFKKVCAQCHKIYGEGQDVGPDITLNGRNDYVQLLSNVFDPSLVIGPGYRTYTVATDDGRVISGLLVEDSAQRVVLKVQGGKQEVIPRDVIEEFRISETSLMPEQLERQLSSQEIADLFAFLTLDKPPSDPSAKRLPGVYEIIPRQATQPAEFAAVFQEVAPGFTEVTSGEGGVALLAEHMGRKGVVRTHPVSRDQPAEMGGRFALPAGKTSTLIIEVAHDPHGDWRLVVAAGNSGRLLDEMISRETCRNGWATFRVDLSRYAGQEIPIRMWNQANDWYYEFAYWGRVQVVSE